MVPARERAAFYVVQAELAFELFVGLLGSPSLLGVTHDPLLAPAARQGCQGELRRLRFPFRPFEHQPDGLVLRGVEPVVVGDLDPAEAEARTQLAPGPFAPGHPSKRRAPQLLAEPLRAHRLASTAVGGIQEPDLRRAMNT